MDMFRLVGKRVQVQAKDGHEIGLGTYLWNDEILLDTGKKILGSECVWSVVSPSEIAPFDVVLVDDVRVFEGEHNLRNSGYCLHKGDRIRIEKIQVCGWNHGGYVAGQFFWGSLSGWLLMSEVELPREIPHLRLVG